MKKILLTLACSFLLSACLAPAQEENKNQNTNTTPSETQPVNQGETNQNSGNGSENTNTNEGGNEQNNNESSDEGNNEQGNENQNGSETPGEDNGNQNQGGEQPNTVETKTKTVSFLNGGFTNSSLDQAASQQNFINWFNGTDDLLISINYSGYSQLNWIGNEKDSWRFSTLILGSSSKDGNIKFNFSHEIKSVKLNIQGYCKYIAYSDSYSVDTDSKFYLDDELTDLSVSPGTTSELEKKDVTKSYSSSTTSLTIRSEDGRVFVHSMEITYIA